MELIVPQAMDLTILERLITAGGPYNGCLLMLYQNDVIPDADTELADLTVANFTGYATPVKTITFGTPYTGTDGTAHVNSQSFTFIMTDEVNPQSVYGWAFTNAGSTLLLASARFDEPIPLLNTNDGFIMEAALSFPVGYAGDAS